MNALQRYLRDVAGPALRDFEKNPHSARHAYLACVAVYHFIDRVTYPKNPGNLRQEWRKKSLPFSIVDMVAHKFKHVVSSAEKEPAKLNHVPLPALVFGKGVLGTEGLNTSMIGEGGIDLHNLQFIIRDAIKFLHEEALQLADSN